MITRVYFEVVDREALSAALDGSPRIERCEGGQRKQASGDGHGRTGSRCRSGSFASRGAILDDHVSPPARHRRRLDRHAREDQSRRARLQPEADTLETVRELWSAQLASGHREDRVAKDRKKPEKATRGRRSGRRPDVRQKSKQLRLFDDE